MLSTDQSACVWQASVQGVCGGGRQGCSATAGRPTGSWAQQPSPLCRPAGFARRISAGTRAERARAQCPWRRHAERTAGSGLARCRPHAWAAARGSGRWCVSRPGCWCTATDAGWPVPEGYGVDWFARRGVHWHGHRLSRRLLEGSVLVATEGGDVKPVAGQRQRRGATFLIQYSSPSLPRGVTLIATFIYQNPQARVRA